MGNDVYSKVTLLFLQTAKKLIHGPEGYGNRGQGKILGCLYDNGEMSVGELTDALNVKPGSTSEMISKLVRKDLVERKSSEKDKRKILVSLTPAGRRHVISYRCSNDSGQDGMEKPFHSLTEDEAEQLLSLLSKINLNDIHDPV